MEIRLQANFLESYLAEYLRNCLVVTLTENSVSLEVQKDDLLFTLNPYLEKEISKLIDESLTYWSWDLSLIDKIDFSSLKFSAQVLREGMKEEIQYLQEDLIAKIKFLLDGQEILSAEIIDGEAKVGTVIINPEHFTYCQNTLSVEILESIDELLKLLQKHPQIKDFKYVQGVFSSPRDFKQHFLVLFKNHSVIGLTHLMPSTEYPDFMSSTFTTIIESEQGQGYSSLLLEKRFEFLKSLNKGMHQSSYSSEGFNRLRHQAWLFSKKYQIPLKENGLLGPAESFAESIYSQQNEIERKLHQAQQWNQDEISVNNQLLKTSSLVLINFLNEPAHELNSSETIEKFLIKYSVLIEP